MENNQFDILSNLPAIFFAICFFINFIMFFWGGILLLLAKGDPVKVERGKKVFTRAFTILFIVILLLAVFFIISYLLQQGEVFKLSSQASEEFPPTVHLGIFPPAPEYIDIGEYHFTGPWKMDLNEKISDLAVYAVLCKREDKYDILYIDDNLRNAPARNEQYSCWLEHCDNNLNNIYMAILWTPSDKYDAPEKSGIRNGLIATINPICKDVVETEE